MKHIALFAVTVTLLACGQEVPVPIDPDPTPAELQCSLGQTNEIGAGFAPQIAGSKDGFAIGYPKYWDADSIVRTVSLEGEAGIAKVVPSVGWDNYVRLASGSTGYLAATVAGHDSNGGVSGSFNVLRMNATGGIDNATLSQNDLVQLTLVGGDVRDYAAWEEYPMQAGCERKLVYGLIGENASVTRLADLGCVGIGTSLLVATGAARGEIAALGIIRNVDLGNGSTRIAASIHVVEKTGSSYAMRELRLAEAESGKSGLSVAKVIRTENGFAALWNRFTWVQGGPSSQETYLTILGADGSFKGTVNVPNAYDMAWNGDRFGLVDYDEAAGTIAFHQVSAEGEVVKTEEITTERPHYLSFPKIASAGTQFGIVWAVDNSTGSMGIRFAPVACK